MKLFLVRALAFGILAGLVAACGEESPTAPGSASGMELGLVDPRPLTHALGSVEQLGGRCPTVSFVIGSIHVVTSRTTLFQRFDCRELTNGTVVDASGEMRSDGTLSAREVELSRRR